MDITSPTVDRSQADSPTATRSQQQKAAAAMLKHEGEAVICPKLGKRYPTRAA
jgi:hypothetical protein